MIEVEHLTKRYGTLTAVDDLSSDLLPVWAAVVVLLAWPAIALLAGGFLMQRRDV